MKKISRFHEFRIRLASLVLIGLLFFSLTNTPVHAVGEPDLTISKTHSGTFSPLDVGRTYAITVSNIGESPTTGTVTVVDTLPGTLSATDISGDGWSCALATLTCTRSDSLNNGESYPVITLTVNVLVNAPSLITNQADVSGGGEVDFTNNTALDDTNVDAKADLVITGYQLLNSDKTQVITQPNANETFWVRMTVENRGGEDAQNFYPGVFLDDKPNYGPDHDSSDNPGYPVTLTLGEVTDYQGYKSTESNALQGKGCRYYDPAGSSIDPDSIDVQTERGNYHPVAFLPGLAAGATTTADIEIAYPAGEYPDPVYENIREGLPAGSYSVYLYVDPVCNVVESIEDNNQHAITINVGTQVDVSIAGMLKGSYFLAPGQSKRVNYAGLDSGPVVISSSGGMTIIAALRDAYFVGGQLESFVQLMGLPQEQLSTTYYFPAYNNVTLDGQLRFGNVGTQPTLVTVTIAGVVRGTYPLNPGEAKRINYAGLDTGPVVVSSSGGVPIIAALRDVYYVDGRLESFAQLMGLPMENLSTKYYFPAYNNVTLDGQLRFGNVGNAPTTVTVTIAGVVRGSYVLNPSESKRVNYAGLDAGPVVVESSGGVPITAALRDAYFVDGKLVSFVQLMGLPQEQLSTTYNFPAYNNVTLDGQLRFGNVGNSSTTVTVTIAGVVRGTYPLNPSEAKRVNYAGLDAGPVVVSSSGGVPIIAALRDAYFVNGKVESFAQLMGLPQELLSSAYFFPAYNNVTLDGQLRFGVP